MKKIFRKLFIWLYKEEIEKIEKLTKQSNDNICEVRNFIRFVKADVGVDVHINSPSWAVFCIQGKKQDFVKLVQFKDDTTIMEIEKYIRNFEVVKIDANRSIRKNMFSDIEYFK